MAADPTDVLIPEASHALACGERVREDGAVFAKAERGANPWTIRNTIR